MLPTQSAIDPTTVPANDVSNSVMTATERRASASLASIFALRMLGLFLVLPVFALEAHDYVGGSDPALIGLAMGMYGLAQAILHIPFGLASDHLGRKRIIVLGLVIFVIGSVIAGLATSVQGLIMGRAVQGSGAISAVVTALLADQTRDRVRTKAMAMVGISIGLMFALSLVLSPLLVAQVGLSGLFFLTAALAFMGIAVVLWRVPPEQTPTSGTTKAITSSWVTLKTVLTNMPLLRMNVGVFILHAVQLAMWSAVPQMLVQAGLVQAHHWWVYLPAVMGSFILVGGLMFRLERKGYLRVLFLVSIALIALVQLTLGLLASGTPGVLLGVLLFLFFCGFNVLEASQPSLVSRLAPAHARGAAMGVYNTLQSLGLFAGGALGGTLMKHGGAQNLFGICAACMLVWLAVAWGMQIPARDLTSFELKS